MPRKAAILAMASDTTAATAGPQAFYALWQDNAIRERLFAHLSNKDICSVRLASSACCNLVTKRLFVRTHLTFTASSFTKPCRIQALSRIGHHIEHLTFCLAHSEDTFLPPLIHPLSGREISFLYTPHTSMASVLTRPKYGNPELGDVLTQQYPPLFHAATNVPSFLHALKLLTRLRHLTIKCPGQSPQERYRRDIVDYALISLRIAIERSPLHRLCKLSLSGVHPAAFNYLRHVPGFGAVPSAGRRWRQIRKLYISVDAWDFYGPAPGLDHLKIIDDYVRNMAPQLEKLSFTWLGDAEGDSRKVPQGPCPIALSGDPLFSPPADEQQQAKKLFNEVTGPMSPLPPPPRREPMNFPRLRCLTLRNTTMNSPQLRDLVERHKSTIREFDFENVALTDGGSWDAAFAPVLKQVSDSGSDVWSRRSGHVGDSSSSSKSRGNTTKNANSIHTPPSTSSRVQSFRMSSVNHSALTPEPSVVSMGPPAVAAPDDIQLPEPSAAVAAVSRKLLDLDVEGLESYLGLREELPYMCAESSDLSWHEEAVEERDSQEHKRTAPPPTIREEDEEDHLEYPLPPSQNANDADVQTIDDDEDEALASDIAAAHEASLSFSTRLKKRRIRRRKRHPGEGSSHPENEERSPSSRSHRGRHHQGHVHSHSAQSSTHSSHHHEHRDRSQSSHRRQQRSRKNSASSTASRSAGAAPSPLSSHPLPPPPPPPPPPILPSYPAAVPVVTSHPFANRTPPPLPPLPKPSIVGQYNTTALGSNGNNDENDVFRPRTPEKGRQESVASSVATSATVAPLTISAPILDADPLPVLLQPTVYDPSASSSTRLGTKTSNLSRTATTLSRSSSLGSRLGKKPSSVAASPGDDTDSGLSPIQLHIEQEEAARRRLEMAEDADARSSALKKAKEAVLVKLSREFNRRMGRETAQMAAAAAAATAAEAAASVSMSSGLHNASHSRDYSYRHQHSHQYNLYHPPSATSSLLGGLRLRERLFGEHVLAGAGGHGLPSSMVASDYHRSMESNSAVVPLIFSHA